MHWTNSDGEDEIVTAPLDGTILEGVTRQAVIDTLVKDGFNVQQRKYTMPELCLAVKEGRVKEVFSSGTAVTVTPVKEIVYNGGWHILLLLLLLLLLDRCHPFLFFFLPSPPILILLSLPLRLASVPMLLSPCCHVGGDVPLEFLVPYTRH